jgi:hypothetical protein
MRPTAPILVDVLGNVGEVRKVAERANDVQHVGNGQRVEQSGELGACSGRVAPSSPVETDGRLPDRLDPGKPRVAGLRPEDIAEDAAQEADVFLERPVLVDCGTHGHAGLAHALCGRERSRRHHAMAFVLDDWQFIR